MRKWENREMSESRRGNARHFLDGVWWSVPTLQISRRLIFPLWLFLISSLAYFLILTPCLAESSLRVVQTNADSLILEFELPPLQSSEKEIEGRSFVEVTFEGAAPTMEIGRPRLPVYSNLIGIPTSASPYASIMSTRSEIRQSRPIIPAQQLTIDNREPTLDMDTNFYRRRNTFHPVNIVEIVPLGFIREQRVARLQIQPVQYNPARGQLKIYHKLQIRINFLLSSVSHTAPISPAVSQFTAFSSQPFEQLLGASLLNYDQAKAWRQYPGRSRRGILAAPAAQRSSQEKYKILINRTGIYEITYRDLRRVGADLAGINLDTVKMENTGRGVGVYIFDRDGDGRFDTDDSIVFYGQAIINNKFTDDNVYWLFWEGIGGSRVGQKDAKPKTSNAPIPFAFKKTEHLEEDRFHDALVDVKFELADHYFWTGFTRQGANKNNWEKNFRLDLPRAAPPERINRNAQIRIRLQGASRAGNAKHVAIIRFNGRQLDGAEEWRRQAAPVIVRNDEQRRLIHRDSPNFLTIVALDQNDDPKSKFDFYLDWFELEYWHTFEASGGFLEFNSDTEPRARGTVQYHVTNLDQPGVDVYKIIGGSIVAKLVNGEVNQAASKHEITFEDNVTKPSSYVVVQRGRYSQPTRITPAKPSTLRNPANQADYIMISHRNFIDGIGLLKAFRQSQGLSVMVVDIETVYDQFSNGIFNPLAIQKFLRYAYTSWRKPAPTYVLLVGDAHYDYKNSIVKVFQAEGHRFNLYPIYVPTFHGWSPQSGETAMDHRFVTVSGDDTLPDMFIGRLSVQFPHELAAMVRKIIDYEDKLQTGRWQGRIMEIADNNVDHPTDDVFEQSREKIIEEVIPVAYDTRKVYLRQIVSPERTKQAILKTIDEGVLILEYAGHGGTSTWADESIFRIENAQQLRNRHLPFIITTTCLNGQFDKPLQFGQRSMSEQFMMGRHGAVGTLSATRLTFGSANARFDEDLFHCMFTVKPPTLGAIIADAKTKFIMKSPQLWIPGAEQYTLFGDPATRLALPDLEISVELEEIALDPNKQIVIRPNQIGRHQFSPITGKAEFIKATDFSTGAMSALALFANDLDADPTNDRPRRRDGIQVWQGEFGEIRIPISRDVAAGRGVVRLFAFDNQRAAVGGTKFWTYQPVIYEIREAMDAKVTQTLNLSVQIVDNEGFAGIKSVEAIWSDTVAFKNQTVAMIPDTAPPAPAVKGGVWYKLQAPIPLPKRGKNVRYQIVVTDTANNRIQTERKTIKVPEGPNITVRSANLSSAPIRYTFSKELKAHTLIANLVNDGGLPIDVDIEVWFSEGNPDRNNDNQIDADAKVLGHVVVRANEWRPGNIDLQEVTATLILAEPLSTGLHRVYVLADPEGENDDPTDGIIGKINEPRTFDNKGLRLFFVNEFTLKANEELTAFSLDRIFNAFFPIGASEPTSLAINTLEPSVSFQPGLTFAPLPRIATLRSGAEAVGSSSSTSTGERAYAVELHSDANQLAKPAEIKLRFDLNALKDNLQKQYGVTPDDNEAFDAVLQGEIEKLGIYAWQEEIKAWKGLPSEVLRDEDGNLTQEKFVTLTQVENTSVQKLQVSHLRIDPNLAPVGKWVIFFLDADRYEVLLQRRGNRETEKLSQTGHLDKPLRDEIIGIELNIPRGEIDALGRNLTFELGDILTFETESFRATPATPDSGVRLVSLQNTNRGDGSAHVRLDIELQSQFEVGSWLIFFRDSDRFEIRNHFNETINYSQGTPILGRVNQPIVFRDLGLEVFVNSGDQPFEFGDKIKFSTALVGVVSTKVKAFRTVALMMNSDQTAPKLQLWVNDVTPESGSVIPPRPEISLFLEDENGIDVDSLIFAVSKDGAPFKNIKDFDITTEQITTVPIRYKPTLFIGQYLYRIWVKDLNGNELGGKGAFRGFLFFVEENPDLQAPTIEIRLNGDVLTDGVILEEQPQFEIQIAEDKGIDPATVQLLFGNGTSVPLPLSQDAYLFEFDATQPTTAQIAFEPDLANDDYQIQVLATDVNENAAESPLYRFRLDEPVEITNVLNAPNPVRTNTAFTYNLVQIPDRVTIKIYTVSGRLIRTLEDASARRHYNETYWDGRDENGVRLANGIYFYRVIVETDDKPIKKTGKLAILR